jgi:hypothetical protein
MPLSSGEPIASIAVPRRALHFRATAAAELFEREVVQSIDRGQLRRSPQPFDAVRVEHGVVTDDLQVFQDRLSDEHPIERIAVRSG